MFIRYFFIATMEKTSLSMMMTLMINLMLRHILDATSWTFALANLGVAAAIAITIIFLQPHLTRERIVLSR